MENSLCRHILISPWCNSYNFINIRHIINMYSLTLSCSNDSQKCEWKILEETQKTQIETQITQEKQRENSKEKNFNLKTWYCFLELSYKHNIHISCDFPNSCFKYLVNAEIMHDARRAFFKRWLVMAIFELLSVVFRSWG